ncbi:hypothetical protein BDA96_06G216100 [Sorghum bicolor]|jgi:hypothetical protein|uniref:Uncharacterized protein n=1 Tax=Sorghum bicolor TaxID=4558 RepID=A0A921QSV9_SORBI|nr:hypothetical protein BDA96_06G216100 [Sorghum bicolor]
MRLESVCWVSTNRTYYTLVTPGTTTTTAPGTQGSSQQALSSNKMWVFNWQDDVRVEGGPSIGHCLANFSRRRKLVRTPNVSRKGTEQVRWCGPSPVAFVVENQQELPKYPPES